MDNNILGNDTYTLMSKTKQRSTSLEVIVGKNMKGTGYRHSNIKVQTLN